MLVGSFLLFISIIAGKTSYRFGIPTLVLFLIVGMLAGSEGIIGIEFNDPKTAQFIGVVSLNVILFSGGLETSWSSVKPILWQGVILSSLGVFLTAMTLGLFVWYITDFSIYEGLLLGAIVSSTDAAAVFSILRSKSLALKSNLRPTLELESGSNDPMAYVLTIMFLGLVLNPSMSPLSVIPIFVQQMFLGSVMGLVFGWLSKKIINRIKLDYEGLYPVLVISIVYFTFSFTDFIGGNGFLAVYLSGLVLGNQDIIHKKTILRMFDGLSWLMQIVLFLTLGLLVTPSSIWSVAITGILVSGFLIVVARPVSVLISLLPFKMKLRRRAYISWVGLRGAVPIVFATYPLLAGIEKADMIFNIVFFISITSIIIQGTSLPWVARLLKVSLPVTEKPKKALDIFFSDEAKTALEEITIMENSPIAGKKVVELNFPEAAIIAMIKRGNVFITPNGSTELAQGDMLMVLSDSQDGINQVYDRLGIVKPVF